MGGGNLKIQASLKTHSWLKYILNLTVKLRQAFRKSWLWFVPSVSVSVTTSLLSSSGPPLLCKNSCSYQRSYFRGIITLCMLHCVVEPKQKVQTVRHGDIFNGISFPFASSCWRSLVQIREKTGWWCCPGKRGRRVRGIGLFFSILHVNFRLVQSLLQVRANVRTVFILYC